MSEQLRIGQIDQSESNNTLEAGLDANQVTLERGRDVPELLESNPAENEAATVEQAVVDVHEALEAKDLSAILESIDFSDKNFEFVAMDSYHAEASTGSQNTRIEGRGSVHHGGDIITPQYYDAQSEDGNKWGDPRNEAHYGRTPIEKVGIRKSSDTVWAMVEKVLPIPGWRGKLGFKRKQSIQERKVVEPSYTFDYEFAAPSNSDDNSATEAGNHTGQNIRLSLKLSQEQAEALSGVLENDPSAARTVLDTFVAKTGDNGKWNAEIFDEDGAFHDPGKRYGDDLRARDVRPRYEAAPYLKPEVIGLVGREQPVNSPVALNGLVKKVI